MLQLEKRIRDLLHQKAMSVKELSRQLDMSQQNLYMIFKRDSCELKDIRRMAEIFQTTAAYFVLDDSETAILREPEANYKLMSLETKKIAKYESQIKMLEDEISKLKSIIVYLEEKNNSLIISHAKCGA